MADVFLLEPPAASGFGSLRTLGSIGTFKADMAWPPLDLMIVAGLLRGRGFSVELLDANSARLSYDEVKAALEKSAPKLLLFTASTPTIYHDLRAADIAKSVSPSILTAVTSTHVNALPLETLALNPNLDYAIPNDSEFTVLELARGVSPELVPGLAYRMNGVSRLNPPAPPIERLDDLGVPAHDLLDLNLYRDPFMKQGPMAVTYFSRGCVNQPPCIMCSACFYGRLRHRSVHAFMKELRELKRMGVRELRFPFEGGFNRSEYARELFEAMIAEKLGMNFTCNARADCLSPELLALMKAAGCTAVNIGCESADANVLELMRKHVTPEQVRRAASDAKKAGLEVLVYFVFGLPGETRDTMRKTLRFAKSLEADLVTFGVAIPHPGTEFYSYLKQRGYLLTEDWSRYNPMLPPPYSYPGLSSSEIYEFSRKAYRSYYLRPRLVWKRLRRGDWAREWKNFTGFAARYIKKQSA